MRKHWGILAVALAVAACGKPVEPGASSKATGSAVVSSVTVSTTIQRGDGAPHEAENRGAMQPGDLSASARRELTAAAKVVRPGLEKQRAASDFRPETTVAVLTAAGYSRSTVFAHPMSSGTGVVFGVSTEDGCLVGDVRPARVLVEPRGAIAEWGCDTPDTH